MTERDIILSDEEVEEMNTEHLDLPTTVHLINKMARVIFGEDKWAEVEQSNEFIDFIKKNLPVLAVDGSEAVFDKRVLEAGELTKAEGYTYKVSPETPSTTTVKFEFSPNDEEMLKKLIPILEGKYVMDPGWEAESLERMTQTFKKALGIDQPTSDKKAMGIDLDAIKREIEEANK